MSRIYEYEFGTVRVRASLAVFAGDSMNEENLAGWHPVLIPDNRLSREEGAPRVARSMALPPRRVLP